MSRIARIAVCTVVTLSAGTATAAEPAPRPAAKGRGQTAAWSLGKIAEVVPAEVREQPEGRLAEGYTIRGSAVAVGEAPFPRGTFLMTLSSFFPAKDMPRQPRGMYYVSGKWRLVKEGVQVTSENARGPGILQGTVVAALPEDPTAGKGAWTMRLRLTPSSGAGPWTRGEGMLVVDGKREAQLSLRLD